jgi:cytoskeletal protein RodZ
MLRTTSRKKLFVLSALAGVIVAGGIVAATELTGTTHIFHKEKNGQAKTAGQATKGEQSTSNSKSSSKAGSSSQTSNQKSGDAEASVSETLRAPSGNFVSNHHPNLSGSPAPSRITSVCNTNPGASCKITFTKDGVTKSLPTQTIDGGGSTYWDWKLQDIGLTAGSWKIVAVATLGNQTMTAGDALNLEVSP